jgi:membrane protease subunit HflC
VNKEANNFGVEIVDVRIKRADLPKQNEASIYERMKTDRLREANEFRAQGQEVKQRIEAEADRQVTVIRAEAQRDARRLKGEGDAERTRITNEAFAKDPAFYEFLRSMEAYENSIKQSRLVISPDSEKFKDFFRYLEDSGSITGLPKR